MWDPQGNSSAIPSPNPPLQQDCNSIDTCNGYCLFILNVTITDDTYIHAMNLIVAVVLAVSLIIITLKLNKGYNNVFNLEADDQAYQQAMPMLGLSLRKDANPRNFKFFLPYYSAYIQVVTFWFLAEVIVLILPPSQTMIVISSILFAGHGFLDNSIIVIFFFRKLNRKAIGWSFFLGLLVVGVKFAMIIAFPRTITCGWCALFSPQTSALYANIVLLLGYIGSLVAALGLVSPRLRARPQLKVWSLFLIVVYTLAVTGIALVKNRIDAGYCVLTVGVLTYNSLYAYLLYYALSRDSEDYIKQLRDDTKANNAINSVLADTRDRMEAESITIIDFDKIHLVRVIGTGGFAEVYLGTWNSTAVAVKRLYSKGLDSERKELFLKEVSLMSSLRHPNIVLFLGVSFTTVDDNPLILTEYMERGALFELLHENDSTAFPYRLILSIAIDIAKGMSYLHDRSPAIIHRDLKSHNILLDGNWVAKVADFGLSRPEEQRTMTRIGTPQWSAPEVLRGERYGPASDVYSYGVILYELMERKVPHDGVDAIKVAYDVAFGNVKLCAGRGCPPLMRKLLDSCLSHDPAARPSFDDCLRQLELICEDFHPSLLE